MTITKDSSTPAQVDKTTSGSTATTASFTAPANALLLAWFESDSSGQINTTIADTGTLTWTRLARLCTNTVGEANTPTPTGTAQSGYISVWKATTSSSASRTVTVTVTGAGGTTKEGMLSVLVYTDTGGAPGTGATGAAGGSASAPSKAVTTTAANSLVLGGNCDWSAAGAGTAGSAQTMIHDHPGTNISAHVWTQNSVTASSGTAVTMNLTAPASQTWNQAVIEITANGGAGPTLPPIIVMPPRRP